ncbi:MAG: hypothetical protein KDD02_24050 [Phaeodactylibacter sp.]|nr:hypothetical protein [Phaeodactylibacter sp.]MCB9301266.1 tryptophan-rich sensory protein [Lewinellaceae bacterium]
MSQRILQALNVLGFALVLTLNTLANALPINGMNTGEVSALYPNLFVPAGFTFSIWGIIYLLLLGFVIFQFRKPAIVQRMGPWFFLSCLFNASWIPAWHYLLPVLSLFIMLGLLGSLILIYQRVYAAPAIAEKGFRWWVQLPFSVYLGWITVATIANVTAVLVHFGWNGWGINATVWTVAMIAVATGMGLWFTWRQSDIFYALVVVWALVGIIGGRNAETAEMGYSAIIITAAVGIGMLGASVIRKSIQIRQG